MLNNFSHTDTTRKHEGKFSILNEFGRCFIYFRSTEFGCPNQRFSKLLLVTKKKKKQKKKYLEVIIIDRE